MKPIHPGEILMKEFMEPHGILKNELAHALCLQYIHVHEIVNGKRAITARTALRLARYFTTSAELWMGLQSDFDLAIAQAEFGKQIESEVEPRLKRKEP